MDKIDLDQSTMIVKDLKDYEYEFPIVGIGASAGGLSAFESFFSGMPINTKPLMAFVLVQHISPDHRSRLVQIIQKYTNMNVYEITDGMKIEISTVYIIPPGVYISIKNGGLLISESYSKTRVQLPINSFFNSMAMEVKEKSIGIVLSGSGKDGTVGIESIKREGGLVLAQNRDEAEFESMPSSAIKTGLVDFELSSEEMITNIEAYLNFDNKNMSNEDSNLDLNVRKDALDSIFDSVYNATSFDFSNYKKGTMNRRIQKRMFFKKISSINEYATFVLENPSEASLLLKELLVGVTDFFRDTSTFEVLESSILVEFFKNIGTRDSIRIWSAGCSTGEEAYSLAILIREYLDKTNKNCKVSIFATDIDEQAIGKARLGIYPSNIETVVSNDRLSKYFTLESDRASYKINKNIRDMLFFSIHDVLKDPPFSKLDIISCRNLLIYFEDTLQNKLFSTFHYSLKDGGLLFLGSSESVGNFKDVFETVDVKAKIYKKVEHYGNDKTFLKRDYSSYAKTARSAKSIEVMEKKEKNSGSSLNDIAKNIILNNSPISGIIINKRGNILYLHGETGDYLDPNQGSQKGGNIFQMTRQGLSSELIGLFGIVTKTKKRDSINGIKIIVNKNPIFVNLTIMPLKKNSLPKVREDVFLLLIQETNSNYNASEFGEITPNNNLSESKQDEISGLKHLLKVKENYIQITTDELQATNEDLESLNEEMQSVNEELQSTNEELETTTEELQSINEELNIINTELNDRVSELSILNDDMENFISGTNIPTLFLNPDMTIMRVTANIASIINIKETDVGRQLSHFVTNMIDYKDLIHDCKNVLKTEETLEIEASTVDNKSYIMKIQPYRTIQNTVKGVIVTFFDITSRVESEEKYKLLNDNLPFGLCHLQVIPDIKEKKNEYYYLSVNETFEKQVRMKNADFIGKTILGVFPDTEQYWMDYYDSVVATGNSVTFEEYSTELDSYMKISAYMIGFNQMAVLVEDVSESRIASRKLKESEEKFKLLIDMMPLGMIHYRVVYDSNNKKNIYQFLEVNKTFEKQVGMVNSELADKSLVEVFPKTEQYWLNNFDDVVSTGNSITFEDYSIEVDGYMKISAYLIKSDILAVVIEDVTTRVKHDNEIKYEKEIAEKYLSDLREAGNLFKNSIMNAPLPIMIHDEDGNVLDISLKATELTLYTKSDIRTIYDWTEKAYGKKKEEVIGFLRKLHEFPETQHNAEFLVTTKDGRKLVWEFNSGYIGRLPNGKSVVMSVGTDITEKRKTSEKLLYISYRDSLTGLYNRRYYEDNLIKLDLAKNYPLTIVMSDINGLKLINDAFGHQAGDKLLIAATKVITDSCRETDLVARIGGDEFIIVMPNTSGIEAEKIIDKINMDTKEISVESIELSIAFGYATKTQNTENIHDTFRSAEDLMYRVKLLEIPSMRSGAIETILNTLYEKDKNSEIHSRTVSNISEKIASAYGMNRQEVNEVKTAGLLHDIGKIIIPISIIVKEGKLTPEEYELIKSHPEIGFRILNSTHDMRNISNIVLSHHERWDGLGYPRGIKAEDIPIQSRIITIADSFDAMTSERTYRNTFTHKQALKELIDNAGTQFDPKLVKIFEEHFLEIIAD